MGAALSFSEQSLWYLDRLQAGTRLHSIPAAIRVRGLLRVDLLEAGIQEIIRRHETLRSVFAEVNGELVRRPAAPLCPAIAMEDLSGFALQEGERRATLRATEEAGRPFDLAAGPLIRALLLRLTPEDHVLLVHMHNIVADDWSMGVLLNELKLFYNARWKGEAVRLPALRVRYSEYARWQRERRHDPELKSQLGYWREHLEGAPAVLDLPADRARPASRSVQGGREYLWLEKGLRKRLDLLAREEEASPFVLLLAGFNALLFRYTGQADLVVGVPTSGRSTAESYNLIGLFANKAALRTDLSGDPSFRELVRRVRRVCWGAHAHSGVPLETVVEALRPERSLAITPLFQVMCSYQEVPPDLLSLVDVETEPFHFETGSALYDLTLLVWEHPDSMLASLEYSRDLFDPATIRRMLRNLEVLLERALEEPDERISGLPVPGPEERDLLFSEWNKTAAEYPREQGVHELFEGQAQQTPEGRAVVFEGEAWSYRGLDERAEQIRAHLRAAGVGPGMLVGLCLERSPEMVAALLGIWKAGAAYVAMDPTYPVDRLQWMVEDSGLQVLLTSDRLRDRLFARPLSENGIRVLSSEEAKGRAGEQSAANGARRRSGAELAYLLYTSGSTGRPKGVPITHRALSNFLNSMRKTPGLEGRDALLAVTTLSFDIAGLEIYLPLTTGACVVLAGRAAAADGRELMRMLEAERVTVMQGTPATWRLLLEAGWAGTPDLKVLCGGEEMPGDLAAALLPRCGSLWNLYGPTETTIWSTAARIRDASLPIPVGRPIDNTRVYVLGERRELLPIGARGELYIGGEGLSPGYWKNAAKTAEKFVPDPFREGETLYRTGDVARWNQWGEIEILGRRDEQVKLRGFRIEPGEIEAALRAYPAVEEAAVVLEAEPGLEKRLVAYLRTAEGGWNASALRRHLERRLPGYMIPAAFHAVERIPLTPNGKVDRRALRQMSAGDFAPGERSGGQEAADEVEGRLLDIWCYVLGREVGSVEEDFFELGGDSLLSVRLFSEIRRAFGVDLPLATLFTAPTVRSLGQVLRGQGGNEVRSAVVPIQRGGAHAPLYCIGALSGEVILFRQLAFELGPEQPVLGLQPFGLKEEAARLLRVEDIAEYYIRQLRAAGLPKPFALLGYSFGGMVAVEMARELAERGEGPGVVILIDSTYLAGSKAHESWGERMRRYRYHLHQTLSGEEGWRHLESKLRDSYARLRNRNALRVGARVSEAASTAEVQMVAMDNYRAGIYSGPVHLFRAEARSEFFSGGKTAGWGGILTDLTVHDVPGDHGTINTGTNLSVLARGIRESLGLSAAAVGAGLEGV